MTQRTHATPATILIVENEAVVCLELVDWLEENGLIALTANNADEAIAILDSHPDIELLVTDIKMPGSMDGVRLAHYGRYRWPPLKIIFISGMIETPRYELPRNSVFIPKPCEHQDLWEALLHLAVVSPFRSSGREPTVLPA